MKSLMEKPFELQHVALYAKGWYRRTEDFYKDLGLMLEMDGYPGYEGDHDGIMNVILNHWKKWAEWYNSITPANWNKKDLERLITVEVRLNYRRYRKGTEWEKRNFTDFYDNMIMAMLLDWNRAETKYINLVCPDYTEEAWPNDAGLFSQSQWYKEAEEAGIKYTNKKKMTAFFNKKIKEHWKKFEDND